MLGASLLTHSQTAATMDTTLEECGKLMTYEEIVEMAIGLRHILCAMGFHHYNMHATQHLFGVYLFHREGRRCLACQYNYAGHAVILALANTTFTHSQTTAPMNITATKR